MSINNLSEQLKKIQKVVDWFENQADVDIEKGLEKVKEGAKLIASSKKRLQELENEFEEVKKSLDESTTSEE